jgi:hypothetical protein
MFNIMKYLTADGLHDPQSHIEVVGNPLDMILLLVEARPVTGYIPFRTVLLGLEFYDNGTILGILLCLCKSGLVDLEEFRELVAHVRRLTNLWNAKELEEMTRVASKATIGPALSKAQVGRFGKTKYTKEKGKLHRWLGKLKSGCSIS